MKNIFAAVIFLCCFAAVFAAELNIDGVTFEYRVPKQYGGDSRIMVLFGGRNWLGERTLKSYGFDALADKYRLFLISPSFRDREYWKPAAWSGAVLQKAVGQLERKYGLLPQRLFLYGYSAGGQCAALFADWMPERVAAWGAHACCVYPEKIGCTAPALVTCGTEDYERFAISRTFVCRYRENGGELLWKPFAGGHGLSGCALELARVWFAALLAGEPVTEYGEDGTMQTGGNIDPEYCNPLRGAMVRELWRK